MKFTREMAVNAAVSDLKMFLDIVKGFVEGFASMDSRSEGVKSPSGPTKMHKDLLFDKSLFSKLFFEFTSANNRVVDLSIFSKKFFSFITFKICGGIS